MIKLHLRSALSAFLPLVAISAHATWTVKAFQVEGSILTHIYHGNGTKIVGNLIVKGKGVGGFWKGTDESWVSLLPAGASSCHVNVLSGGRLYGHAVIKGVNQAGYWTETADSWVSLHPPGTFSSSVQDVQEDLVLMDGTLAPSGFYGPMLYDLSTGTKVGLRPEGSAGARVVRMHNGKQVGTVFAWSPPTHFEASLWSGTSESHLSLHPKGFDSSELKGIWANQQVGFVYLPAAIKHAGLWTGTAASFVDLHPVGYSSSQANDVWNGIQIGTAEKDRFSRAGLWRGTAGSWVDLHALTSGYFSTEATRIWSDGKTVFIGGYGISSLNAQCDGLLWSLPVE